MLYCLEKEEVSRYLKSLFSNLKYNGIVIVGSSSNLSLILKLSTILKRILIKLKLRKSNITFLKKIGYLRSPSIIIKYLPKNIILSKVIFYDHFRFKLPKLVALISKYILPIASSSYLAILSKKKSSLLFDILKLDCCKKK